MVRHALTRNAILTCGQINLGFLAFKVALTAWAAVSWGNADVPTGRFCVNLT
jgi:hypothetical protein